MAEALGYGLLFAWVFRYCLLLFFNPNRLKFAPIRLYMMPLMQLLIAGILLSNATYRVTEEERGVRDFLSNEGVSFVAEGYYGYDTSTNDGAVYSALSEYKTAGTCLLIATIFAFAFQIYATKDKRLPWKYAIVSSGIILALTIYVTSVGVKFGEAALANSHLIKLSLIFAGWDSGWLTNIRYIYPIILAVCFLFYYKYLNEYYSYNTGYAVQPTRTQQSQSVKPQVNQQLYKVEQPSISSLPTTDKGHKRCPYCGEEILAVAKKCKHCGEWLNEVLKEYIRCSVCGEKVEKGLEKCPCCHENLFASSVALDIEEKTKPCLICGEEILDFAKKCKHCGEWQRELLKENVTCPICGELVEKGLETCPFCKEAMIKPKPKETVPCPICGEQIEVGIDKCPYCHESQKRCPLCGETIPLNSKVCPVCNSDLTEL